MTSQEQDVEIPRRGRGKGAILAQAPRPRNESALEFVQVVHSKDGKTFLRSMPRTAKDPTPAQVDVRIRFGRAARETRSIVDAKERARLVANRVRGSRSEFTRRNELPKWAVRMIAAGYDRRMVERAARAWAPQ